MGKHLRPRRGNENNAIAENLLLLEGEVFFEYPEGRGLGKSPGRIIIGNGNDKYSEKNNSTTNTYEYQPFITDPQIYVPQFDDSSPKDNFEYDDEDRGTINLKKNFLVGIRTLPDIIGIIKEVLCRHTDNLKYDDKRIKSLEEKTTKTDILDIKVCSVTVSPDSFVPTIELKARNIPEGYDFFKWDLVTTYGATSSPCYIDDPISKNTYLRSYTGTNLQFNVQYTCFFTAVKRNKSS